MRKWTYEELKNKLEMDLDLQDETFIQPEELLGYFNEAIDVCEATIHKLGAEDEYFRTKDTMTLTQGETEYDPPADIYANKFRSIQYAYNGTKYPITRFRGSRQFEEMMNVQDGDFYKYAIDNSDANGVKLVLFPAARETGAYVTRWYIRNAKRLVDTTDYCDIPEVGVSYVLQFVKKRCYEKEGHPNMAGAKDDLNDLYQIMVDTLSEMVPDGDNAIELDMGHYEEHA